MNMIGAKLRDLKIHGVLKQEGGLKGIREPDGVKSSMKLKSQKSDSPVSHSGGSDFYR
jgi:hypothetical protein